MGETDGVMSNKQWPVCLSNCADCGIGTWAINEYYMVKDRIWKQAWAGRRKSYHGGVLITCWKNGYRPTVGTRANNSSHYFEDELLERLKDWVKQ
jgi:hypothetical protein